MLCPITLRNFVKCGSVQRVFLDSGVKQVPLVNSVRFRKPRWLPIAKSKEFYVRKPTPIVPEEAEELYLRYSKYRADVASIRLFLKEQLSQKSVNLMEEQEKDDAADLKLMEEQVKEYNNQVASLRQKRQEQEILAEQERIEKAVRKQQDERLQRSLQAEKKLEQNKAAQFIPLENLDEAIETMLDSRSDYNYAVTNSGELIPGEYPDLASNKAPPRTKMSDVS
ncbi:28S ribosomal protein S26, mitochondrial [Elysia marginata]|uniref:Small ribosomal subunit protein mS26 n=1 Tax=Elysia marginata TaxID=1093978 RepID=A0AAV4JNF0_9GAST|nr:28S ribosomal protein S26, mitochondrial [Elysia marginata]